MAKKSYRIGMPNETIQLQQKELEVKPQVQIIEVEEGRVTKNLEKISSPIYQIKVNHPSLRRRQDPTVGSQQVGLITDQGIYDVYAEVNGWAQLKDASWVMLQFCSKI